MIAGVVDAGATAGGSPRQLGLPRLARDCETARVPRAEQRAAVAPAQLDPSITLPELLDSSTGSPRWRSLRTAHGTSTTLVRASATAPSAIRRPVVESDSAPRRGRDEERRDEQSVAARHGRQAEQYALERKPPPRGRRDGPVRDEHRGS